MSYGRVKPPYGTQLNRAHPLARGLVGCWLFNEGAGLKASDSSGMGNHGTLTNFTSPSISSGWVGGSSGGALAFDGDTDMVVINPRNTITNLSGLSILTRFYYISQTNSAPLFIDQVDGNHATMIYMVGVRGFRVEISNDPATRGYGDTTGNPRFAANTWNTFVMVFDGTLTGNENRLKGYLNNTLQTFSFTTNVVPSLTQPTSNPITKIGYNSGVTGKYCGYISETMIWNRALSAQEIAYLYASPYCMFVDPLVMDVRETYLIPSRGRLPIKVF